MELTESSLIDRPMAQHDTTSLPSPPPTARRHLRTVSNLPLTRRDGLYIVQQGIAIILQFNILLAQTMVVSPCFLLFRMSSYLVSSTINQSIVQHRWARQSWSLVALYLSPKISFPDHPSMGDGPSRSRGLAQVVPPSHLWFASRFPIPTHNAVLADSHAMATL